MLIIAALYYFLPAYFANMAPNFFRKTLAFLAKPIDCGKSFRGQRLLGANKTWRGVIMGTILAIVIVLLQRFLSTYPFFQQISLINYSSLTLWKTILLGFLLGFGALVGDSAKSFFKRQAKIPPGKSFFPFDQLDFVIGGLLFSFILFIPAPLAILTIIVASPILHIVVKFIGYILKIDKAKF
ncbi:MAG: CDP-archaeol synthase [Nanoarchaeota archaeon]